ncbi:Transthyretin-like protein 46 [Toxocara canis]|uniref:Transthyretin-like protein 46 n=1 Tax=Toxocara canis TaxID=6265 RepID=A0A0B2VLT1_TOXCA|nr:Transthyretin-like protein 46 [Toxocara canis]
MRQLFFLLALVTVAFASEVALRSTSAKGKLLCGNEPIEDVHVRLYRMNSEDKSQILDYKVTSSSGTFQVEGNTQGRPVNETTLTPVVRIYHKCGEDPKNDRGFRRMQFQIPSEYVFDGRLAREAYDAGALNMQLIYPGEKREKHFEQ